MLTDISGYTYFVAQTEIKHAGMALSFLLETIIEKQSNLLAISKLEVDTVKVEIYCSVCGLELCYTE